MIGERTYEVCVEIYSRMDEEADDLIWEGSTTDLFREGAGLGWYTPVMRALQDMECVSQMERGGGKKPSRWKLWKSPTRDAFQMRQMNRAPKDPDSQRDWVARAIHGFQEQLQRMQDQITVLDARVRALEGTGNVTGN